MNVFLTIMALIVFSLLIISLSTIVCIFIALKRGEDVYSDEVMNKYVEISIAASVLIILAICVGYFL